MRIVQPFSLMAKTWLCHCRNRINGDPVLTIQRRRNHSSCSLKIQQRLRHHLMICQIFLKIKPRKEKIDDQRSVFQRVFPPKNALRTKRPVFYSPGEFTGRGSETHLHKRKVEILRCRGKQGVELKFTPKTKKPTRRPVGGESKKWWTILRLFRNLLSTPKRRIFQVSNGWQIHLLEKFSDWISIV